MLSVLTSLAYVGISSTSFTTLGKLYTHSFPLIRSSPKVETCCDYYIQGLPNIQALVQSPPKHMLGCMIFWCWDVSTLDASSVRICAWEHCYHHVRKSKEPTWGRERIPDTLPAQLSPTLTDPQLNAAPRMGPHRRAEELSSWLTQS